MRKFKPEDRKDDRGIRVSCIRLFNQDGKRVDTKTGDIVRVCGTSTSASEEGVVDGFTPQKTRVLIKDDYRYFRDKNLMFVRHGPRAKMSPARTSPIPPDVSPSVQVVQPIAIIERDDAADCKKVVNEYFDQLAKLMEKCVEATDMLNVHIETVRERFGYLDRRQDVDECLAQIRSEVDRSWVDLSEVMAGVRDEMLANVG